MTNRFYFDLTNGPDTLRDTEGFDAIAPGEVIEEAWAALDEMRRNEEAFAPEDGWQLIIRDEDGATLQTIPLNEATVH